MAKRTLLLDINRVLIVFYYILGFHSMDVNGASVELICNPIFPDWDLFGKKRSIPFVFFVIYGFFVKTLKMSCNCITHGYLYK